MEDKKLYDHTFNDARIFFLQSEAYCNFDLPEYFNFAEILQEVNSIVQSEVENHGLISNLLAAKNDPNNKTVKDSPNSYDDNNCRILKNKDGNYDWRPLSLIHPVLYCQLVDTICKEDNWLEITDCIKALKDEAERANIFCCSDIYYNSFDSKNSEVAEAIDQWYNDFTLGTIQSSLGFRYALKTDIQNCYGSIYTHSLPWAIYGIQEAKAKMNEKNLGNTIDAILRSMSYGQTNGIPQGSILMDFLAELVLAFGDKMIAEALKDRSNYKILRYRDDYRIFANDDMELKDIVKTISEQLAILNFKLNPQKTIITSEIIISSVGEDKFRQLEIKLAHAYGLTNKLLLVDKFSHDFPNSGQIKTLLQSVLQYVSREPNMADPLLEDLFSTEKKPLDTDIIRTWIGIIVDIMHHNVNCYSVATAIISKILDQSCDIGEADKVIEEIQESFSLVPNVKFLEIWLQRIKLCNVNLEDRKEKVLALLRESGHQDEILDNPRIWNTDWLNPDKITIDESKILDQNQLMTIQQVIPLEYITILNSRNHPSWLWGEES